MGQRCCRENTAGPSIFPRAAATRVAGPARRVIPYGSSMVVGDQRPGDRRAGLVVMPDRGGHRQDALGDADGDPFEGPPAVGFEVELALEGVVDRFDQLADRLEQGLAGPGGL